MKTLLFTLKTFCLSILLSGIFILQGMENNYPKRSSEIGFSPYHGAEEPKNSHLPKKLQYTENSKIAHDYNNIICPLTGPMNDLLSQIFSYCHVQGINEIDSLEKSMKNFIKISGVCKKFNSMLTDETIGSLCQKYPQDTKNKVLDKITGLTGTKNYLHRYLPIYILIHAGTSVSADQRLLRIAINNNDHTLVKTLFNHGASPDLNPECLFAMTDYRMACLFIKNNANLHISNIQYPNVLWAAVNDDAYSAKLIDLYIKHGVNPRQLHPKENSCLLHTLAKQLYRDPANINGLIKRTQLVIDAIPDMINHTNNAGETPLDNAYNKLLFVKKNIGYLIPVYEKLVALFRENGALTAQELRVEDFKSNSPTRIVGTFIIELQNNNFKVTDILQKHIEQGDVSTKTLQKVLHLITRENNPSYLERFLRTLSDQPCEVILAYDEDKNTPLHTACYFDCNLSVESLVKPFNKYRQSLLFAQNKDGKTALMIAAEAKKANITILEHLINAADKDALEYLNISDSNGLTAFDYARKEGNLKAFILLEKVRKAHTKIECSLCLEEKKITYCHTMSHCNGDTGCTFNFCNDCLLEHIGTHLNDGSTQSLMCPNIACGKKINEPDIRIITEKQKDLYDRYLEITAKEHIANIPHIKHCQTPNCTFSFILEENAERFKIQCACNQTYCSHCLFNHSLQITCDQAKEERVLAQDPERAQQATEKWIAENTKPCPQCNTSIQKNGGPLYMFCRKCAHEFCWKCMQPHDHTMNHPCGIWENEAQLNQAQQNLIQQLEQQELNEPDEQ